MSCFDRRRVRSFGCVIEFQVSRDRNNHQPFKSWIGRQPKFFGGEGCCCCCYAVPSPPTLLQGEKGVRSSSDAPSPCSTCLQPALSGTTVSQTSMSPGVSMSSLSWFGYARRRALNWLLDRACSPLELALLGCIRFDLLSGLSY